MPWCPGEKYRKKTKDPTLKCGDLCVFFFGGGEGWW